MSKSSFARYEIVQWHANKTFWKHFVKFLCTETGLTSFFLEIYWHSSPNIAAVNTAMWLVFSDSWMCFGLLELFACSPEIWHLNEYELMRILQRICQAHEQLIITLEHGFVIRSIKIRFASKKWVRYEVHFFPQTLEKVLQQQNKTKQCFALIKQRRDAK